MKKQGKKIKASKQATPNGPTPLKKRRSAILNSININSDYLNDESFVGKFRKSFSEAKPFSHYQFKNLIDNSSGILEEVEQELQDFPGWARKENDLYSLYQTPDFKALDSGLNPLLFSFRQFFYGPVKEWLQNITGVELSSQVDMNGSCYTAADGLLPHSDLIDTRRFAFVFYFTPFVWKKEYGGQLYLYNSNNNDEPVSVAKELPPTRNSLVIFEVTQRSWHRVAEILSESDPRLSVNGWFHSKRVIEPRVPKPFVWPRESPKKNTNVSVNKFMSDIYSSKEKQDEIQKVFGDSSEISLKQFLKNDVFKKILSILTSAKFVERGPIHKRNLYECEPKSQTGILKELTSFFETASAVNFITNITGCDMSDVKVNVSVSKLCNGSYSVVGDEDVEQAERDGFSLEAHLFIGEAQWSDEAGGDIVYLGKEDDEELITVHPEINSLSIVLRDPEVVSFTKYANAKALGDMFVISARFYNIAMDETSDEDDQVNE